MSVSTFRWLLVAALLLIGALSLKTARVWTDARAALAQSSADTSSPPSTAAAAVSAATSATEAALRASLDARFPRATLTRAGERYQVNIESAALDPVVNQIWDWEQSGPFVVRLLDASQIKSGVARVELQLSPRADGGASAPRSPGSPTPKQSP